MKSYNVTKNYKPKWTIWRPETIRADVIAHKRRTRRAFKQFLKTGSQKDFNRSQKLLTRWEFD